MSKKKSEAASEAGEQPVEALEPAEPPVVVGTSEAIAQEIAEVSAKLATVQGLPQYKSDEDAYRARLEQLKAAQ